MRPFRFLTLVLLLLPACVTRPTVTTNLLPGLTYYEGSEKLTGKMVFLLCRNAEEDQNGEKAGAIYEFAPSSKSLRKITDAPSGNLFVSQDGNLSCVLFWFGVWRNDNNTNAFVYSDLLRRSRTLNLEVAPMEVALVNGHVFFRLYQYNAQGLPSDRLLDFDMMRDERRWVELPGAAKWEAGGYSALSVPRGQTNTLEFRYTRGGKRLGNGRDYEPGIYRLNVQTGDVKSVTDTESATKGQEFVAFDGRHVFFTGSQGPAEGFELVSSPWTHYWTQKRVLKGEGVKVLHSFSKSLAFNGGSYVLSGISPCGHFALVRFMEPTTRKSGGLPGWASTYYLVDVSSGDTRVLLKDAVEHDTTGSMSPVHWVRGR